MKNIFFILSIFCMYSCKSYIDLPKHSVDSEYMIFEYGNHKNKFIYKNNVAARADKEIYKPTHFEITLPKNIVNWAVSSNHFFFEYKHKQMIYIYSSYENKENEEKHWWKEEISYNDLQKYIGEYWTGRKYNENSLYKIWEENPSSIYTNGKYKILLFNIKKDNVVTFTESIKTFKVNSNL